MFIAGSKIQARSQVTRISTAGHRNRSVSARAAMAPYTLYTWGTPNGWKASVILEELGLEYDVKGIDIMTNEQKKEWFTAINPNGRIPALVDHESGDLRIFETGAIMWYLCEKVDKEGKFWPKDLKARAEVMSWLMFQMGGVGPMQGQANHFVRYAPEKIFYGMNRYVEETKRLYKAATELLSNGPLVVMNDQLAVTEYLAGDQYTIADMANFCWVVCSAIPGVDIAEFPKLQKWAQKINARPAVQRGLQVPSKSSYASHLDDEEARQKALADARDIVQKAKQAAGK